MEIGVTNLPLPHVVARRHSSVIALQERLGGVSSKSQAQAAPDSQWQLENVRRDQSTGRYNPLWEELEMGLWRRSRVRI